MDAHRIRAGRRGGLGRCAGLGGTGRDQPAGDGGRDFAAGAAATVAIDAAVTCTHECIQVLGGIGYTWEHDAHLYYRRALSLRALAGRSAAWASEVARLALGGATRSLAVELPDEAAAVRAGVKEELAAIAAAPKAEQARLLAAGGWVTPHLPAPWGRAASPLEQLVIAEELRGAGLRPPGLGIGAWVVQAWSSTGPPSSSSGSSRTPCPGRPSGASCSASPVRAPTWPASAPRRCAQ